MRQLLCLSLLILPAAAAPDGEPAEDPRRLKPDHAPTPFTAEEIRKACPEGRANVFRAESAGKAIVTTMRFVKCDEKGAEIEITAATEDGTELGRDKKTSTWKELQTHASFPEKDTKITEETTETPAGKFDCWLYTVSQSRDGKQVKTSMHFAKSLAGPPVRLVREVDGKVESSMTLVECKEPGKKEERKPEAPGGN